MADPRNQDFIDDPADQSNGEHLDDLSSIDALSSSGVQTSAVGSGGSGEPRSEFGLAERLTEILVDDGDGDLLLQQSDRDDRVFQWLQALDMHVAGACRADERLKPLLKLNVSSGVAEDCLLAQISQHFEPSEVGMLARCFCIPLVSIRVGKISKQGALLCPTATRGNLNLMVLPSSDLRLSFIGDDGHAERLFTLSGKPQCFVVAIEEIPADNSGRSFLIKLPDGKVFYFWCSEKSKLLGVELLTKMKDLLKRKPSIAELTGISESRLGFFATNLRAYLVGSTASSMRATSADPSTHLSNSILDLTDVSQNAESSGSSKPSRCRQIGGQVAKANSLYQCSLSPRSSSFKEGLPRSLSSLRSAAREKLKRHLSAVDNPSVDSPITSDLSSSNHSENGELPEVSKGCAISLSFLESLGKSVPPSLRPASQVPSIIGSPLLSPYYCWCPPVPSTLQHSVAPQLPALSTESQTLPPFSSLLTATRSSSLLLPTPPLNLVNMHSMDFPALLPDALARLPISKPCSQQIPTFTPLMCDPIVHIPVIDVCSSGQGYLVSAGPAISTIIPPLHSKLVNPLIPETDSMVEKGARETLRLLISSSSQYSPPLLDALPAVLTNADEKTSILVTGSRGLYDGTRDVNAIANSIAAMGMVSFSVGGSVIKGCDIHPNVEAQPEGCSGSSGSCSDAPFSNLREERTE